MKCTVIETFKVKTSNGETELPAGQVITLPKEKAIKLLNEGKITPIEKVAYKVYSEILGCCLWIVNIEKDMKTLRSDGIHDPAYSYEEIRKLKGMNVEGLKVIHKVKETFENAKVLKVDKR